RFRFRGGAARRGVAAVGDAHVPHEVAHVARAEDVAHEAAPLVHVEAVALGGDDAGCILAAVLQDRHPVVQELVHGTAGHDSDDAAHGSSVPSCGGANWTDGAR